MVELGEAGRELAGAGARSGHHHERARRLDELVPAIAVLGDDEVDVVRIPLDRVMQAAGDPKHLQARTEGVGGRLTGILRDHDRGDREPVAAEDIGQAQDILVVGDPEVPAGLALLDMVRVDGEDNLNIVRDGLQHA